MPKTRVTCFWFTLYIDTKNFWSLFVEIHHLDFWICSFQCPPKQMQPTLSLSSLIMSSMYKIYHYIYKIFLSQVFFYIFVRTIFTFRSHESVDRIYVYYRPTFLASNYIISYRWFIISVLCLRKEHLHWNSISMGSISACAKRRRTLTR